jgi:hypothetical protein
MNDISERVQNDMAEQLPGKSGSADDLRHEIETLDRDFDFDSYAPYTHQETEVIGELEKEYWRDAEDICGDKTYKATEWEEARRAYAGALAYTAYSSIWEQTKQELIEAIEQFESDAQDENCDDPNISLSLSCPHGWASHDREDSDGTMYFVSGQLDGCNGLARQACGVWMSVCFTPEKDDETESEQSAESMEGNQPC